MSLISNVAGVIQTMGLPTAASGSEKEDETSDGSPIRKVGSSESVDRSLECPVCCSFLCEPLTLDCTHSFCRSCLLQATRLAPDGRLCPICRWPASPGGIESRAGSGGEGETARGRVS